MEAEGFCVKCRARRKIQNVKEIVTKTGRRAITGTCLLCGAKMFKFLGGFGGEVKETTLGSDDYRRHVNLLRQAWSAYHSQEYEEALTLVRETVQIDPNSLDAQILQACCCFAIEQYDLGVLHITMAIRLASRDPSNRELITSMWGAVIAPNLRRGLGYGIPDGPFFIITPERSTPTCPECDAQMWVSQRGGVPDLSGEMFGAPTEFRCRCGYRRGATQEESERDTMWACFSEYVCRWQDAI